MVPVNNKYNSLAGLGMLTTALACGVLLLSQTVSAQAKPADVDVAGGVITPENLMKAGNFSEVKANYKEMLNFNDCLDFKVKPCLHWCPTPLGPKPAPGALFEYREPTAVVATKCHQGSKALDSSAGVLSGALSTTSMKPDQACATNRVREEGLQQRTFFDATLYKVTIGARYRSSATPLQATQSLTCGVLGIVGLFTNPLEANALNSVPTNVQAGDPNTPPTGTNTAPIKVPTNINNNGASLNSPSRLMSVKTFFDTPMGQADSTALVNTQPVYAADNSNLPVVKLDASGNMVPVGGLLQTGASQQLGMVGAVQAEAVIQLMNDTASEASNLAGLAIKNENSGQLCSARQTLFETVQATYKAAQDAIDLGANFPEAFMPGSYLGADFAQTVDNTRPIPSCPLTHAGYMSVPDLASQSGYKRIMVNCRKVCKEADECYWVPQQGYGGNCETNRLSQNAFSGMVPACNGFTPEWAADEDGNMDKVQSRYIAVADHRRILNEWLARGQRDAMAAAVVVATHNLDMVNKTIRALGGACDDTGNPTGTWGKAVPADDLVNVQQKNIIQNKHMRTIKLAQGAPTATTPSGVEGFNLSKIIPTDLAQIPGISSIPGLGSALPSLTQGLNITSPLSGMAGLNSLTSGASGALGSVMNPVSTAFGNVGTQLQTFTAPFTSAMGTITTGVSSAFNSITGPISSAMSSITGPISSAMGSIGSSVSGAFGSLGLPAGLGFSSVMGTVNTLNNAAGGVSELMRSGGVAQTAKAVIACTDPSGLCPVWKSEFAQPQWATPPLDVRNAIMPMVSTVGGIPCNGSQLIKDLGSLTGGGSPAASIMPDNPLCDGWGTKIPSVGWAYNQDSAVAAANIFGKVRRIGENLFILQSDISGKGGMFSYEYPQINRTSAATGVVAPSLATTRHKSSKCYQMGTHDPRWRTKGESLIPDLGSVIPTDLSSLNATTGANANEGYNVFSAWKHTKCCIPLACPWNVKRHY